MPAKPIQAKQVQTGVAPVAVSAANTEGTSEAVARADHSHIGTLQAVTDAGNLTSDQIGVSGGTPADGAPLAQDVVAGDGSGSAGFSAFSAIGGVGRYAATDVSGAAVAFFSYDHSTNEWIIASAATAAFRFASAVFRSSTDLTRDLGIETARFKRLFLGQPSFEVLEVGDASAALDDEMYVRVSEPAAGTNTLTLPASVTGYTYLIQVTAGAGGDVDLATTGGDTINGGASPLTIAAGTWLVFSRATVDNDWVAVQIQ